MCWRLVGSMKWASTSLTGSHLLRARASEKYECIAMVILCDYMFDDLLAYKTDYVTLVCTVLPSVEYEMKKSVGKAQKAPGAKAFNCKEQFKNGVLFDQVQSQHCWLKLQCCPASSKGHKIRISFNFHTPEGLEFVRQTVDKYVPIGFSGVIANGLVTRLDIALDFKGVTPSEFVWLSNHSYKKSCIFNNDLTQQLETVYLGSVHSEFLVIVYDRRAAKSILGKDSNLSPVGIPDFDITRVEIRHQPKTVSQVPMSHMQEVVNQSLSLVHVLKAKFLNEEAQDRLMAVQRVGYQRYVLKPEAAPEMLLPQERKLLAKSVLKKSLLEMAAKCESPLLQFDVAKPLAA